MAQNTTLEGLRSQLITSIFGRRLALDSGEFIVGPKAFREQVEGFTAATTLMSTSVAALSAYGMSMLGSTQTSGSTAWTLAAPVPGTKKVLFNPTTGSANVTTTGAGAFVCSTASAASTQGNIFFVGKGAMVELIGISTSLWGVMTPLAITTVTTGNLVQIS